MLPLSTFIAGGSLVQYNVERGGSLVNLQIGGKKILYADAARRNNPGVTMRETTWMFPQLGVIPQKMQKKYACALPRHGWSREKKWHLQGEGNNVISLQTHSDALTNKMHRAEVVLEQSVRLGAVSAGFSLCIKNSGTQSFCCTPGHHAYYRCEQQEKSAIVLSENLGVTQEMKEVWLSGRDTIKIKSPRNFRVFIPGIGTMQREIGEEFKYVWLRTEKEANYICIEPVVGDPAKWPEEAMKVPAGQSREIGYTIRLLDQ